MEYNREFNIDDDNSIFGSRAEQIAEITKHKQTNLELRVVNQIIKKFGTPIMLNYIKGKNKEAGRDSNISLVGFYEAFPDFPVFIRAKHIYKARDITLNNLKRNFEKSEIYEAFQDVREEAADIGVEGLIGVVFEWQFDNLTIMHNNTDVLNFPGFRVVKNINVQAKRYTYIIEPLSDFFSTMSEWHPNLS